MSSMDYVPAKVLVKQSSSTTYGPLQGTDSSSTYALAVVPRRPDYVDYSMTKGGLRSWLSVIVFVLLVSAFSSIISSSSNEEIEEDTATKAMPEIAARDEEPIESSEFRNSAEPKEHEIDEEEKLLARLRLKAVERVKIMENHKQKVDEEKIDERELLEVVKIKRKARKKSRELLKQETEAEEPAVEEITPHSETEETTTVREIVEVEELVKEPLLETVEIRQKFRKEPHELTEEEEETTPSAALKKAAPQAEKKGAKVIEESTERDRAAVEREHIKYVQRGQKKKVPTEQMFEESLQEKENVAKVVKVYRTKGRPETAPTTTPISTLPTLSLMVGVDTLRKIIPSREKISNFFRTKPKEQPSSEQIAVDKENAKVEVRVQRKKGKLAVEQPIVEQKTEIKVKYFRSKGNFETELKKKEVPIRKRKQEIESCELEPDKKVCDGAYEEEPLELKIPHKAIPDIKRIQKSEHDLPKKKKQMPEEMHLKSVKTFRTKGKFPVIDNTSIEILQESPEGGAKFHRRAPVVVDEKWSVEKFADTELMRALDKAEYLFNQGKLEEAGIEYGRVIIKYPDDLRAYLGKAETLDRLAELEKSNKILQQCIEEYEHILELEDLPDDIYRVVSSRLIDRLQFRGWVKQAMRVQETLVKKFPQDTSYKVDYGLSFLILGNFDEAKKVLSSVLTREPNNGYAAVLYGYILKTSENKLAESVKFLREGIESDAVETQDARFYYHLGDALQRLDRAEEAYEIYEKGAQKGLFLSKYQRSIYNVAGIRAQPYWTLSDTDHEYHLKRIEKEWQLIRDEGLALLKAKDSKVDYDDKWLEIDDVLSYLLFSKGQKLQTHCERAPKTCALLDHFLAASLCQRCRISFIYMRPGTCTEPRCGPTNCRLRAILTLTAGPQVVLRVAEQQKSSKRGKFLVFDDSFEHEMQVSKLGKTDEITPHFWLALQVDFWHPDLADDQKRTLTSI